MDNKELDISRPSGIPSETPAAPHRPASDAPAAGPAHGSMGPSHGPSGPSHGPSGPRRPGGRRHFATRRKVCRLCAEHISHIDFKQGQIVKSFCSESGKILSRRITGACAKHQRQISRAVKVNRNLSLMAYDG